MPGKANHAVVAVQAAVDGALKVVSATGHATTASPAQLPTSVDATATSDVPSNPGPVAVFGALLAVAVAAFIAWWFWYRNNIPADWLKVSVPVTGVSIFAVFFVAAQGTERLLEPIADWLQGDTAAAVTTTTAAANKSLHEAQNAPADQQAAKAADVTSKVKAVANATARSSQSDSERKIAFWAVASIVGITGAAALHLMLFRTIGFDAAPPGLDVIATGLVIGAGTKPLHDLTTLLGATASSAKSTS